MMAITLDNIVSVRTMAGHPRLVFPALGLGEYDESVPIQQFVLKFNDEEYPCHLIVTELELSPEQTQTFLESAQELETIGIYGGRQASSQLDDLMLASADMLRQIINKPRG